MFKLCHVNPGGGGGHILRHSGMFHCNGSLFHKKSLNMGPIFYKSIPKYGFLFSSKFPKFRTPKNCEKWAYIARKIPKNGYLFLSK